MTTPSSSTIKFSDLAQEYSGILTKTISMSQIGYGGEYNKRNSCTDLARNDSTIPFHSLVANLPVYNGNNSNIRISSFYSKDVYAAPPDGAISINSNQTNYNFTSLFELGRNYNPNQNKRSSPLFQHVTNNATIYSTTSSSWAGVINNSPNAIMYLKNNGGIYGCGGRGGDGQWGALEGGGGNGDNGSPALLSEIYTILDNSGVIYGGGGGGGGGAGGHVQWNQPYATGPTNSGGGGGGGGGGQSFIQVGGGTGGNPAPNFGGRGGDGGSGTASGPGGGGGGGGGGERGNNGIGGGNGGTWGSAGGSVSYGAGGAGGDSYIGLSGKIITGNNGLLGYSRISSAASSLSGSPNYSGTYANDGPRIDYGKGGSLLVGCYDCGNPVSSYTWYNISPPTVEWYGSGLVVNVTRYPNGVSGPTDTSENCNDGSCYITSCGYCTYYWSYSASVVNGGSQYISGRSKVRISVDGVSFDLIVY